MITVLAGGVGAARFLRGLIEAVEPASVTIIGNTADDEQFLGLHVSPDLDTVVYTLADAVDAEHGWGLAGESYGCREQAERLGEETWFRLGDRDLATHVRRTQLLREGRPLSEATGWAGCSSPAERPQTEPSRSRARPVRSEGWRSG